MTTAKKTTARKTAAKKTTPVEIEAGQALDLVKLNQIGGLVTGKATPRPVKWTTVDDDGNEVTYEFTVGVVKMGLAANERLWGMPEGESRMAMIIHEAIRLGEDFKQRITYEDACRLNLGLFNALFAESTKLNPKPTEVAEGDQGKE